MIGIGSKVRVKGVEDMKAITNMKMDSEVQLKSGLFLHPKMLFYCGMEGTITEIAHPGKENSLNKDTYKIGILKIYWDADMLEEVE